MASKARAKTKTARKPRAERDEREQEGEVVADGGGEPGAQASGGDDDDAIAAELVDDSEAGAVALGLRPRVDRAERATPLAKYDPLQAYMRDVQRHPLLTPAEEREYAIKFYDQGDVDAAAKLVTSNLRLVVKIAYEYRRAHKQIPDLIQEGSIGLMQAVKKFDPYK